MEKEENFNQDNQKTGSSEKDNNTDKQEEIVQKNPNEDRKAVISAMTQKAGGKLHDLWLTRGHYDVAVHAEVPDFESIAAVKMMIMASGAMDEMEILEVSDFNAIGAKAAEMMTGAGAYKAPGS